jgi:hypothetical protein
MSSNEVSMIYNLLAIVDKLEKSSQQLDVKFTCDIAKLHAAIAELRAVLSGKVEDANSEKTLD